MPDVYDVNECGNCRAFRRTVADLERQLAGCTHDWPHHPTPAVPRVWRDR